LDMYLVIVYDAVDSVTVSYHDARGIRVSASTRPRDRVDDAPAHVDAVTREA